MALIRLRTTTNRTGAVSASLPSCSVPGFLGTLLSKPRVYPQREYSVQQDQPYLELLKIVADEGESRLDRTGVGTFGIFGAQLRFDLSATFPLLTTKRVHWRSVVLELLWFLRGDTNVRWLQEREVSIWDEWADENGDLGPIYGRQWRAWKGPGGDTIDQIQGLVADLKKDPYSRRHLVIAWNPGEVEDMALPPCHCLFQFWVSQTDNSLHCQLYQRSADIFLGVPFNIASYALLTCMIADTLGFNRGSFIWTGGDVHLYQNHVEQAAEQLSRDPRPSPILEKITKDSIFEIGVEDIVLRGYDPHPAIRAPVAV